MKSRLAILALLIAASFARAQGPYERIERAYAPYMAADDALAFPMKVKSLAADPYTFWRGSKDLFFEWSKTHSADWLADSRAILPNHGDLHLGNIGTYVPTGGWGKLAFGMVDFDDSAKLPFQLELLQGLITLELTARQNQISLDDATAATLLAAMLDNYRIAVNSRRNATNMLVDAENPAILKMLKRSEIAYSQELSDYLEGGPFRSITLTSKGKLKEILRPAQNRADDIAQGLAQAIANEPDLKSILRVTDAKSIRSAIKQVVQRTRLGSSGSQGLKKYLILLDKPLRGIDHDVILYLKQEIPSAAERAGVIEKASIPAGRRVKEDMDRLTDPLPFINSWCEIGSESYWVSVKEPWSDELDPANFKTIADLTAAAKIWGTVTGATHREQGRFEVILPRLTPALSKVICDRSTQFIQQLEQDFTQFRGDERVQKHLAAVEQEIKQWELKR